ncbi:MAG: GntR family transcriptional regulator [Chitinivibrionales bacterium]|nr:GntR family transcriptional regulator [Chitinivibrionales bacterium]MBD3395221.1 GntR family transcriptional regulator [Chitinivibrionales bacterium]
MSTPTERLRTWLDKKLETAKPGEWLPCDRDLASHFDVSHRTVQRLMKSYATDGKLSRVKGRGTCVPGADAEVPGAMPTRQSSVATLVEQLHDSMRKGELERGKTLPQVKWFCRQFGVSPHTVAAAYRRLQEEGLVVRTGRNYRVGSFRSLSREEAKREVYLFTKNVSEFREAFKEDILAHSYHRMHNELSRHGYILLFETFDKLQGLLSQWGRRQRYPFGLVLFRWRHVVEGLSEQMEQMRQRARQSSVQAPAVLVDLLKVVPKPIKGLSTVYRSTLSTVVARALASFVRQKGYSRVVFFLDETHPYDVDHGYSWASLWPALKIRSEMTDACAGASFALVARPRLKPFTVKAFLDRQVEYHGDALARALLKALGIGSFDELEGPLHVTRDFGNVFPSVKGKRTAWVFITDQQAQRALRWARGAKIRVPEDLAIIGLENNSDFFSDGITTVEPDWETIGYLMAHALIGDFDLEKTSRGFMRVAANVHERLTT